MCSNYLKLLNSPRLGSFTKELRNAIVIFVVFFSVCLSVSLE